LFAHNPVQRVIGFLNNETTVGEELRLISSLPTWPFMRAAMGVGLK
jgi:lycopene beta-cyclase